MKIDKTLAENGIATESLSLSAEDQRQLKEWGYFPREYAKFDSVQQMFEKQAEANPDAVAIVFSNESLSYGELNRQGDAIAQILLDKGVEPEECVGICIGRSFAMVIGVLGILKAGCAYVPIDPGNPQVRIDFIGKDAELRFMLTDRTTLSNREFPNLETIVADEIDLQPIHLKLDMFPDIAPRQLMNVIYTSGSTGEPKGVMVEHRGMIDKVQAFIEFFELDNSDRHLQFVSFSFDVWGEEVFSTICSGGTVVMIEEARSLSPLELLEICRDQKITKTIVNGSYWNVLVDELERTGQMVPETLRHFSSGAEVPSLNKLNSWIAHTSDKTCFYNVFGPTEASIMTTAYRVPRDTSELEEIGKIPIGQPLPTVKHYILDENLNQVPGGVTGELYIGGSGVARGYLHRPDLTEQRFISDPFSDEEDAMMYKTGDMVRYLPDGNIDFIGRSDWQVKIRGNRVEIEEIEVVLAQLTSIQEAAVTVHESEKGDKRLIAFIVPTESMPEGEELRADLQERLPDYMIPSNFVKIEVIPRTVTGKIDRKSLPEFDIDDLASESEYVAPRNALEKMLASFFCEALDLEQISIHDDFFTMGGDSIKGALLINKLQEKLNKYIYIVTLFDAPTVAKIAEYLTQNYADALAKHFSVEELKIRLDDDDDLVKMDTITADDVEELNHAIMPLQDLTESFTDHSTQNERAIFVLAPPRSGTTLMRVLLGGHPNLFAPPELYLMSYNTMRERAEALSGRHEFWREGLVRAVMSLKSCEYDEAREILAEFEGTGITVRQFYSTLQDWLGEKILVDKTPFYALDSRILDKMEVDFKNAYYVHLIRHPLGMMNSFLEARIAQLFRFQTDKADRQLAELVWYISHANILEFLKKVPEERQIRIRFEDLVKVPRSLMMKFCDMVGLSFSDEMLQPYKDKESRMTDSIHPLSQMLGDVKFHEHKGIESEAAERWKGNIDAGLLADFTRQLANNFGYED